MKGFTINKLPCYSEEGVSQLWQWGPPVFSDPVCQQYCQHSEGPHWTARSRRTGSTKPSSTLVALTWPDLWKSRSSIAIQCQRPRICWPGLILKIVQNLLVGIEWYWHVFTMINPFLLIDILSSIKFNLMETGNNAVQIVQEQGIVPKSYVVWFINPMN